MTITDYYVATDAMGSVTAILDNEGNVLERRSCDTFGEMTCMTPDGTPVAESPTGVDVGFQGQIRDNVTGLYQMGFRWYHPVLGRWGSRDPIGLEGGRNLSSAFDNTPNAIHDIFGLSDTPPKTNYIETSKKSSALKKIIGDNYSETPPACGGECTLITVMLEIPSPDSGGFGHAGIAVGDRFYDWGPEKPPKNYNAGVGYWSTDIISIKELRKEYCILARDLISKTDNFVIEVQFCACKSSGKQVKKFWEEKIRYISGNTFSYSMSGFAGDSCASAVYKSLLGIDEKNALMLFYSARPLFITPEYLFEDVLRNIKNECGQSKGKRAYARIAKDLPK